MENGDQSKIDLVSPLEGVAILWKLKSAIPDGNAEEFENSNSYRGRVSILQVWSSKAVPKDLYNISSWVQWVAWDWNDMKRILDSASLVKLWYPTGKVCDLIRGHFKDISSWTSGICHTNAFSHTSSRLMHRKKASFCKRETSKWLFSTNWYNLHRSFQHAIFLSDLLSRSSVLRHSKLTGSLRTTLDSIQKWIAVKFHL